MSIFEFEALLARDPSFTQCDPRLRMLLRACEVTAWRSKFEIVNGDDVFPASTDG